MLANFFGHCSIDSVHGSVTRDAGKRPLFPARAMGPDPNSKTKTRNLDLVDIDHNFNFIFTLVHLVFAWNQKSSFHQVLARFFIAAG